MRNNNKRTALILTAAAMAALVQSAFAATGTWNGSVDNNWTTAGNWTGASIPNATGDDAIFNTAGAANLNIQASSGTLTVRSLQFNSNATSPVTITVGNATAIQ